MGGGVTVTVGSGDAVGVGGAGVGGSAAGVAEAGTGAGVAAAGRLQEASKNPVSRRMGRKGRFMEGVRVKGNR